MAACAIQVTADAATSDPTVRHLAGRITCHGLWDDELQTPTAVLTGHFDVFAQVDCAFGQPARGCRSMPP